MRCLRCGKDYQTTIEEEKKIFRREIPQHCPSCVTLAPYAHKKPEVEPDPIEIGWHGNDRLPGRLFKVEVFNKDGAFVERMEIERTPQGPRGNVVDEPRTSDMQVYTLHPDKRTAISNHLAPRIHTNLMGVFETGRHLWFHRFPAFVDKATGTDRINVKRQRLKRIEFDPGETPKDRFAPHDVYVRVELKDGRLVATIERSPRHRSSARRRIIPKKPIGSL